MRPGSLIQRLAGLLVSVAFLALVLVRFRLFGTPTPGDGEPVAAPVG